MKTIATGCLCLLKNFGDLGENDVCTKCGQTKCKNCNTSCQDCVTCDKQCKTCFQYTGSTRDGCEITVYSPLRTRRKARAEGTAQFRVLALPLLPVV